MNDNQMVAKSYNVGAKSKGNEVKKGMIVTVK